MLYLLIIVLTILKFFFRGSISSHHLNPCSNLVSLLCRKDRLNRLLVTLLPNNEGMIISTGFYHEIDFTEKMNIFFREIDKYTTMALIIYFFYCKYLRQSRHRQIVSSCNRYHNNTTFPLRNCSV